MKPKIKTKEVCGQRGLQVSFSGAKRTVLILNTNYYMDDEISHDTLVSLCYRTCKIIRKSVNFVYVAMDAVRQALYEKIIEDAAPDSIIYAAEETAKLGGITDYRYNFCMLQKNKVAVVPFRYWADKHYQGSNSNGNALLGFTLRGFVAAAQGKNIINDYEQPETAFRLVDTTKKFDKFLSHIKDAEVVSLDSETTSLGVISSKIISLQIGVKEKNRIIVYFIPMVHAHTPWSSKEYEYVVSGLKDWMLNSEQEFVMQGGSFDCAQLMNLFSVEYLPFNLYDMTAAEFLLDENRKSLRGLCGILNPYRLDTLELGHGIKRPVTQIDKEDRGNMSRFTIEQIFEYGCWDAATLLVMRDRHLSLSTHPIFGYRTKKDFHRTCVHQLGIMLKTYATMRYNGIKLDINNLVMLSRPDGPFQTTINEIYDKLMHSTAGQKANKILLSKRGASGGGLFGGNTPKRILSLTKPEHRTTLFFDVMKLEPLKKGKNGQGSTDSSFQKAYANRYIEVELYRQFSSNMKLKTAFADSLLELVTHDSDFQVDGRVRPNFGFTKVVSGRSSSWDPNAQQVPSRGPLSKPIKKNFTVEKGNVMVAADFSAHEIRLSGIVSRDPVIAATFKAALSAIREFRLGPIPNDINKALEELELRMDVHIINALTLYGKRIHKDDPLRGFVKNVIFSLIYGAMAKKIAKTTESGELQAAVDTIFKKEKELKELLASSSPDKEKIRAIKKVIAEKRDIMERPFDFYLEQAEEAYGKFEEKWNVLFAWMDTTKKEAYENLMVSYPNGRVRHLWGYLSGDEWAHRAMDRRAINSIIQGFSADIGMVGANESNKWVYNARYKLQLPVSIKLLNQVHDALYRETPFEQIPLAVYLTEHAMSTLPYRYYRDVFEYEFPVALGYDVDLGLDWSSLKEWKKRPEMLTDMIRELGETIGKKPKQIAKVVHDWNTIWEVRRKEIEKDKPDLMLLRGNRLVDVAGKLNMFNDTSYLEAA